MTDFPFSEIAPPLLSWFSENARSLPFRDDPTPYHVWLSEIMLQQTRVAAVLPYYNRFIAALPTIESLAAAPEEQLLKLWEGLGYYSRVRNLQKAAKQVVDQYGGALPNSAAALRALPGIGPYTAGAICSIAFNLPEPAVDGNVFRVMARLLADPTDISLPKTRLLTEGWVRASFPEKRAGDFTQALMELGATVCLPGGGALCTECPLAFLCRAKQGGGAALYPKKSPKKPRRAQQYTVFVIEAQNTVALVKRPAKGVLASLWQPPMQNGHLSPAAARKALCEWGLSPIQMRPLPPAKHIFTHLEWEMTGYLVRVEEEPALFTWASLNGLEERYALPSAFKPFLNRAKEALQSGHF